MATECRKVVIIGSGPAAWSAAIYAARAELQPLVFEGAISEENRLNGTLPLGQLALTTEVENYAGFPAGNMQDYLDDALDADRRPMHRTQAEGGHKHTVTGPELMELMRKQAANFGTEIRTQDIVKVDFSVFPRVLVARSILEEDKLDLVEACAIVIATGARANYLGLPSEDAYKNRGVSACAVCDGALPRFRNRPLVVVGGGDSACEEATYLTKFASKVHLVHRRDQLRASKIMAERAEKDPKIQPEWNSTLEEVLGNAREGVTGVRLGSTTGADSRELPAAGVFLAIGHTPNTAFLDGQVALTAKGYIAYTKPFRTATSVPGVFAAGDVADDYYRQAITSAGTGCMAALDAERWLADHHGH